MKIFLTTLTSFLVLSCLALAKKPNFVYIMVDDAGYGDFSCFGQKKFKTPNVDRMAKEGMKMTDFYWKISPGQAGALKWARSDLNKIMNINLIMYLFLVARTEISYSL